MNVSWFKLLRAIPEIRGTITQVEQSKDWYKSESIIYQILKTGATVMAAIGISIYGAMSEQDMQTISTSVAIAVPVVLTIFDSIAAIWLRLRTSTAIVGTVAAQKIADTAVTLPTVGTVEYTVDKIEEVKTEKSKVVS